jgi:hypothetical protein
MMKNIKWEFGVKIPLEGYRGEECLRKSGIIYGEKELKYLSLLNIITGL